QLAVSWIPWSLCLVFLCLFIRMRQPRSTLFPYTPLFRSNEIAKLCDVAGGDAEDVRIAVGSDERIGMQFLYPGLGFGGSCFPKDLRALVRTGEELGVSMELAAAAVRANEQPVKTLLGHMERDLGGLSGKTVAVWGIAFKPKTDDVREAPAIR